MADLTPSQLDKRAKESSRRSAKLLKKNFNKEFELIVFISTVKKIVVLDKRVDKLGLDSIRGWRRSYSAPRRDYIAFMNKIEKDVIDIYSRIETIIEKSEEEIYEEDLRGNNILMGAYVYKEIFNTIEDKMSFILKKIDEYKDSVSSGDIDPIFGPTPHLYAVKEQSEILTNTIRDHFIYLITELSLENIK